MKYHRSVIPRACIILICFAALQFYAAAKSRGLLGTYEVSGRDRLVIRSEGGESTVALNGGKSWSLEAGEIVSEIVVNGGNAYLLVERVSGIGIWYSCIFRISLMNVVAERCLTAGQNAEWGIVDMALCKDGQLGLLRSLIIDNICCYSWVYSPKNITSPEAVAALKSAPFLELAEPPGEPENNLRKNYTSESHKQFAAIYRKYHDFSGREEEKILLIREFILRHTAEYARIIFNLFT